MANQRTIAYFSMEIGLEAGMPTYSGGLEVMRHAIAVNGSFFNTHRMLQ